MKQKAVLAAIFLFLVYVLSYVWIRQTHTDVWEKDNNAYVIFPVDKAYLYYIYRPLSYIDGNMTGIRFHIGQHR